MLHFAQLLAIAVFGPNTCLSLIQVPGISHSKSSVMIFNLECISIDQSECRIIKVFSIHPNYDESMK